MLFYCLCCVRGTVLLRFEGSKNFLPKAIQSMPCVLNGDLVETNGSVVLSARLPVRVFYACAEILTILECEKIFVALSTRRASASSSFVWV